MYSYFTREKTRGLFPSASHEYEVFRFALAQQQDIPKLVPQVDMVDTGSSFAMTYACWRRLDSTLPSTVLSITGCEAALQVSFMADVHRMMELHLSSSPASGPC
ncbi:hypothetical protein NQZ68_018888 [Dissostichus eleginoides]|nr:hypothetical protein NQZ68_018888 [Dissostichus eleginoides]